MMEADCIYVEAGQPEEVYTEHQYMCSECHLLFNTLEDVLIHQQIHTGQEGELEAGETILCETDQQGQQYQCLECGNILVNSEELLLHQEMHMKETAQPEYSEALVPEDSGAQSPQYQCLDCLALFDSPDSWLEHRRSHSTSATHSHMETMEYVLQPDGTVTPINNVPNFVLSEQQAGEILAQVFAQQQKKKTDHSEVSKSASRASLLPPVTSNPGLATMHLQILTAQALADGSSLLGQGKKGTRRVELRLAPSARSDTQWQAAEMVVIHPYECSECSLLFQSPEDLLQHQGEHFLGQEKESAEAGQIGGVEKAHKTDSLTMRQPNQFRIAEKKGAAWAKPQQCTLCDRTFNSANRLSAHQRVHEMGTHECNECGKVFKKETSLQTHLRSHSGVARYLCVDCGQCFTTEMTLIVHRKLHTSDPFHKCQFCNKTFANMTKYLYHRQTHLSLDASGAKSSIATTSVDAAPRRASQSTLAILQRVREKNVRLMPPLTEEEMENMDQDPSGRSEVARQEEKMIQVAAAAEVSAAKAPEDVAPGSSGSDPSLLSAKKTFTCHSCSKTFPSQMQFVYHRRKAHAVERSFVCGVCGKSFKKQIHMRNHSRTHTGERPFQCADCGKTFSSLANLRRHNLIHTGVKPYHCSLCNRSFSQSSNLRQHSRLHLGAAGLTCPDCPATFSNANRLAVHRYTHHPGSPAPFPCLHCAAGFVTGRRRDEHCLEQHPLLPPGGDATALNETGLEDCGVVTQGGLDCDICGKKLNSAANLRLHKLSHLGPGRLRGASMKRPKSHQCLICGKFFVSTSGVALHQRVHTGERPFPCQVCGKRFRQNTHLREHLRTHSGERPFRCEVCGKGFIQSMHLAEHRRTHTGERPHKCPYCSKAFKTFSNLRNHKKTHNRQQRPDKEVAAQVAAASSSSTVTVVEGSAVELAKGQPHLIQIQSSDGEKASPTIMCNEFGETIAIIESSEGGVVPFEQALEIFHTALENGLAMETVSIEGMHLL
ncbi:zinc finger protein 574 [Nerophis ophidion]|uniref:zinc finger protein 574 n=1 Tax=Nerophis ophidion TaxID=159077 RepID=UPI002ADF0F4E|nr:zinc finger protein 574 [Nerophis ophidion]